LNQKRKIPDIRTFKDTIVRQNMVGGIPFFIRGETPFPSHLLLFVVDPLESISSLLMHSQASLIIQK